MNQRKARFWKQAFSESHRGMGFSGTCERSSLTPMTEIR